MATVHLKPKKETSLQRRHPWVFSGAIAKRKGNPAAGGTVNVVDHKGNPLGVGSYSPSSQIAVRMWDFDAQASIDAQWFGEVIDRAIARRAPLLERGDITGYRLIHGESDGCPGLLVDRYDNWLVCAFLATGVEAHKDIILQQLHMRFPDCQMYERSDASVRKKEGLEPHQGPLTDQEPPDLISIQEGACRFQIDIVNGHKTGFYLDQRDNREAVMRWSKDKDVLNCFSYTGGFGIAAGHGGASHVTHIDASEAAIEAVARHIEHNELDPARHTCLQGDVFKCLREYRKQKRSFDLIVMDPPKFVESKRHITRGCRGYKDINMLAFQLLRPGGKLFTFSCSGLVSPSLFQKVIADAALDANRHAVIIGQMSQPLDHPIALPFPEGHYLKGLICQVDG